MTKGRDGMKVESRIGLGLVKRDGLNYVRDVKTMRGRGRYRSVVRSYEGGGDWHWKDQE